ncbi:MAG TPA: guanitoxin biosynthesis heme-dependent pre-guanitoxin N-hydroxylase GntA [Chthoniobacterales bacterium]|jgi:FPC/CPF motif-containing protein YcgG|nr:guanitoxin biosynthesis heme-dependent pre-guanitoxin N-hydroxylase GntA [Chthoniobacterales bacterium]
MKADTIAEDVAGSHGPTDPAFAAQADKMFRELVLANEFPCLGAKAAIHSSLFNVRCFPEMASDQATADLAAGLLEFTITQRAAPSDYATFVAIFAGPQETSEAEFEQLLWTQLRALHSEDAPNFDWDPSVGSDPSDPHFSFSFGGQALYVIGMHANSSREARRFPWPVLVFNPHVQFERLRADGKWKRMQDSIRKRDLDLQGSINPMLNDFGERSEARQYSGRAVGENWQAPFKAEPGKCPFGH